MDPISMTMALIQGGIAGAQGALGIYGQLAGNRMAKRASRAKMAALGQAADMVGGEVAFQQSNVIDQVDAVVGAQNNYFASANIDPSSGSPAILQAMSAAQGMMDMELLGAKGARKKADLYQQQADIFSQQQERNMSTTFGIGTQILNTASKWIGLSQNAFGGGSSAGG